MGSVGAVQVNGAVPECGDQGDVELRMVAKASCLPTVRAVIADLAGRADYDLDAIADLRMAVDEACTALLRLTNERHRLRCVVHLEPNRIRVGVFTTPEPAGGTVATVGFGWRVLSTLVDELVLVPDTRAGLGGVDGVEVGIVMSKHRGAK